MNEAIRHSQDDDYSSTYREMSRFVADFNTQVDMGSCFNTLAPRQHIQARIPKMSKCLSNLTPNHQSAFSSAFMRHPGSVKAVLAHR